MRLFKSGLFRRFSDDRRGVSAVEFAMLAPVMVAFYFGLSEFCQGFMAQKRMSHTAAAVADLVAQTETISSAGVTDVFNVGKLVMSPFPTAALKQRISSVTVNSSGQARVDWSRGDGLTARGTATSVTLPSGLVEIGESVIMTEVEYDYDSPVDYLMPTITRFNHVYYLRPRRSDKVVLTT
ncbi:MAG TPA: TadE/TadG family type IV pilus assembly protein [Caulobacteraceae bacterium]|jgi:Flp pilus assembly protein TadG